VIAGDQPILGRHAADGVDDADHGPGPDRFTALELRVVGPFEQSFELVDVDTELQDPALKRCQLVIGCQALILLDLAAQPRSLGKLAVQSQQPLTEDGSAVSGQHLL